MTTSDGEQHIKPIIVSHDYQTDDSKCSVIDGSSSLENSPLRRVTKSSSSSFKRVSFGNSKGTVVQTYIYESVPTVEEGYSGSTPQPDQALAQSLESSPSKVKVTSSESQAPHSIHPPAALDTSGGGDGGTLAAERRVQIISPPLPSLRKMEVENPFRPDGRLSHEVDPIVETYKHRPFPSGHDSADGSLPPSSPYSSPSKSPGVVESTTNGVKRQDVNFALSSPPADTQRNNAQLEVQHKQVASAKPGHLEVVHIEGKKRKCGCCSIQ